MKAKLILRHYDDNNNFVHNKLGSISWNKGCSGQAFKYSEIDPQSYLASLKRALDALYRDEEFKVRRTNDSRS